jgi:PRC-barrel domain
MVTNLSGILTGMDVLDTNGEKIGKVTDVLAVQAFSQTASTSGTYEESVAPTEEAAYGSEGQGNILQVQHGGVLGMGGTDLYIPVSDVTNVVFGESVTVNCTENTCENLYAQKPGFLP